MAQVLGPATILNHVLPEGVDSGRIAQWNLRDGTTFPDFMNRTANALGVFNQSLLGEYGFLFNVTTSQWMEYEQGGALTRAPRITDLSRGDMVHGETIAHMLPLIAYGFPVGGSWRFFRDSREAIIRANVNSVMRRLRWGFEIDLLHRLFTNTDDPQGSGYSPGFVRGTSGAIDYVPLPYGGKVFDSSHNHYVHNNTGFGELLDAMIEHLAEHGVSGPYTALVSRADTASYRALRYFTQIISTQTQIIDRGGDTTAAGQRLTYGTIDQGPMPLIGYYDAGNGVIELRASQRIPTGYVALIRTFGINVPGNPLVLRVHDLPIGGDVAFGAFIVPSEADEGGYPLKQFNIEMEYGFGTGEDRTAGVVGRQAGSFANPTIS